MTSQPSSIATPGTPGVLDTFDTMEIPDAILRGIYNYGFERPSEIQRKAILPIKDGHDIIAQAQSGTGKTGAFCIGSMCRIDPTLVKPQVLVIVPTRELSQQIVSVADALGKYIGLKALSITGGTNIRDDINTLEKGVHFIVGTPGRIFDLMQRNILSREHIRVLILDEADQMLENRFKEQILCILKMGFPQQTRVALFSATLPPDVLEFSEKILNDPVKILMAAEEISLEGIRQFKVELAKDEFKLEVLCDIYKQLHINQALIYCNKRQCVEWLAGKMSEEGFPLNFIHGDMDADERKRRMDSFRSGSVRVLISTDLLARGIDVQQVSLVINFELSPQRENYIHRIGRSGRYGRKGVAINLIGPNEMTQLKDIETYYHIQVKDLPSDLASL